MLGGLSEGQPPATALLYKVHLRRKGAYVAIPSAKARVPGLFCETLSLLLGAEGPSPVPLALLVALFSADTGQRML